MHRHICAEIDFDCFLLHETLIPTRKLVVIASSNNHRPTLLNLGRDLF